MRVASRKAMKNRADVLCSQLVRTRGACERCGSSNAQFHWAHIIPRRYLKVRWDPRNAWCLCAGCHRFVDDHFVEKRDLMLATIGQAVFDELWDTAISTRVKVDLPAVVEQLKVLVDA